MKTLLNVGVVGLGQRGYSLINDLLIHMKDVRVSAVSDVYPDRVSRAAAAVETAGFPKPFVTEEYREIVEKKQADALIIATPWRNHAAMAVFALEHGMPVGLEVGGVTEMGEAYALIAAYERTGTPFMFLENCCYGRRELMVKNMAEDGVFGEIVHGEGRYGHDLRREIAFGGENRHYRLEEYRFFNRENYPTHELGPLARVLGIGKDDRFVSLVSTAGGAFGLHDYIARHKADDEMLADAAFAQADIVTTVLKTEKGKTVVLTLDTTLPRCYSRGFTVRGTRGMYEEATDSVFLDDTYPEAEHFGWIQKHFGNAKDFEARYDDEKWKAYLASSRIGGHDGMDYLLFSDFFDALRKGRPMPIDVYDAAVWTAVSPLSAQSLKSGGMPVLFPDFSKKEK